MLKNLSVVNYYVICMSFEMWLNVSDLVAVDCVVSRTASASSS